MNEATGGKYKKNRKGNLKAKWGNYGKNVTEPLMKTTSDIVFWRIARFYMLPGTFSALNKSNKEIIEKNDF